MDLSHEDELRLAILFTEPLHAVRIDESRMMLHALLERGEVSFTLSPSGPATRYLKCVREQLSAHALGSPGGYPVFLQRWSRMGQIRGETLAGLLCIAEPEAVVAAAHAPGLPVALARRAWWALPTAEVARELLRRPAVVADALGPELANFLLDDLPFEQESRLIVESVRLLLQPGLLADSARLHLWQRAQRHAGYLTGFLLAQPDALPGDEGAHPQHLALRSQLAPALDGNAAAMLLCRALSAPGQRFLGQLHRAVAGVADQDTVVLLFDAVRNYFALADVTDAEAQFAQCQQHYPEAAPFFAALRALQGFGPDSLNEILGRTDAVGSVMRRKLEPVTGPMLSHAKFLCTVREHG